MKAVATTCLALCVVVLFGVTTFGQTTADPESRVKELEAKIAQLTKATDSPSAIAPAPQSTQDLEKRVKELEQKLAELEKAQQAPAQKLMNNAEVERVIPIVGMNSFFDNGYLVFSSNDGRFKYWLDGRVQIDAAAYRGSENRLANGVEVRRARIGWKATLFGNWLAEIDLDFADSTVSLKDLWMGYSFKNGVLRVGNHKAPFGLDTLTSSKNIIFIERAYVDSWSPDRRLGVSYSQWGRNWQFSGGVFSEEAGLFDNKDTLTGGGAGTHMGYGFVGRASVAPINTKDHVLHIGFAGAWRTPDRGKIATSGSDLPDREDASWVTKLDSRPETHVSRAKFLSTGDMKYVDNLRQYGVELAGIYGPVTFQGEYQGTKVYRIPTSVAAYSDHSFKGWYGQVSCFLTGERRPYSPTEGEFGRVIPTRKAGAVEVGFRYSTLNLDDKTAVDPILGGIGKNATVGLTWFMNANHKILFNVTRVDNNENAKPGKDFAPIPSGTSTTQVPVTGDKFTTIAVRYAFAF